VTEQDPQVGGGDRAGRPRPGPCDVRPETGGEDGRPARAEQAERLPPVQLAHARLRTVDNLVTAAIVERGTTPGQPRRPISSDPVRFSDNGRPIRITPYTPAGSTVLAVPLGARSPRPKGPAVLR